MRVTPTEISIHDAEYYNTVYVGGAVRRTNAYSHFGDGLGFNGEYMSAKDLVPDNTMI